MPPCVRIKPSSTVMAPGPTCFQPAKSLPLKSCFHAGVSARAASNRAPARMQARATTPLRTMAPPVPKARLETQAVQIVVADLDVLKRRLRVIIFDKIMLDTALIGGREDPLEVDRSLPRIGEPALEFDRAGRSRITARRVRIVHIILHVNQREAPGMLLEVAHRVFPGNADPAQIHFHLHEL